MIKSFFKTILSTRNYIGKRYSIENREGREIYTTVFTSKARNRTKTIGASVMVCLFDPTGNIIGGCKFVGVIIHGYY